MNDSHAVSTHGSTVEEWTRALAQSTGSPGGGAGTGLMLAVAASLMSMVAGYSEADERDPMEVERIRMRAQSLREAALRLADEDASASRAFGAAFRLERGPERQEAIRAASLNAAKSSAVLGELALDALDPLAWLALHGNPALVSDVVVAFGALRAALAGARTNVSFDLASLRSGGKDLDEVREQHAELWSTVRRFDDALDRIDTLTASIDHRAAPTAAADQRDERGTESSR
ncbi:cyclodeaminase/cyclohydrolase family protein [Sinomonas terrae]|uniref:Cyclodeaminase/cyclohydrolase family protein n=1 Tax=Sinomonas terrae TaxID=2908838 RepID=A0ABS9U0D5_9MICC|nr:cyclodeaminase/cyclohydrolase family protein [Sinomonas terrae]MCH6470139.1 cyclodeaminase/cyclohydrolase family protein [Sinomonas terrae]